MPPSTGTGSTAAGGTFESDTGGTYQSDTPGTFHSAMTGTFQSDMGGTSIPLLSLLAGCSKNPIEEVKPSEQLTNLELASVTSIETKAAIDDTDFPETGEIGLFLFKDELAETPYGESGYTNVKYAYNSSKSKWTASPSIKVGSDAGYLFGYYPYSSTATNIKAIPVASSLNGDDVMYADKVSNVTSATASQTAITMNHALARVSIKVINKGYTGYAKLSQIKFEGAKTSLSGSLDATTGTISGTTMADVTLAVPSDKQTITSDGTTYECLLVPSKVETNRQTVTLTLTIDGKPKTATLSNNNGVIIAKGTKSNITITLSNTGITVQTVSVDDWNVVEVGGHKVTVKLSEEAGFANDALVDIRTDGSSVTIKALTALTGRFTQCTCTPAGKATCNPLIDATTGICTFTITDVQEDITVEVGYLKHNVTAVFDSDMGAVKLNGAPVTSKTPVQILHGEKAEFTAEAATGNGFVKWTDSSDEDLSTKNPYTISSVTSNITLNAVFGYEILAEVKPAGAGTVTGAGIYAKGSTVTLTAAAGGSFAEFIGWAKAESPGTIISTDNPYGFAVSQPASYVAVFRLKDALSGVFTVAADEQGNPTKKVLFSKGNLWYGKIGDASEATFNFEANQYDTTPSSNGERDNNHISHFMWCDNATNATALTYDINWNGKNKSFFAAKDFTVNGFSGWRVLTGGDGGEWEYLLDKRNTTYGENHRYAAVEVNGMAGLLIFPDDFSSWPSGAGNEPQTFNTSSSNWNDRNYTVGQFTILQNNGCVFLPAAGDRSGSTFYGVGGWSNYWSSTAGGSDGDEAFCVYFSSSNVSPGDSGKRNYFYSVRLIAESN